MSRSRSCRSFPALPAAASPAPRSMPRRPRLPPAVQRSSRRPAAAMVPELLRLRSLHVEIPQGRGPLTARLTVPARLSTSLRAAGVTVVQARSPATAWVARAVARRLGVKWIATLHAPFLAKGVKGRFIEGRQTRADAVIAVSEHVAKDAVARFPALAGTTRHDFARCEFRPLRPGGGAGRPADQARDRAAACPMAAT